MAPEADPSQLIGVCAMKTLTITKQIRAWCLGPEDGGKASVSNRRALAGAAINSVAKSDLPSAEHYWRDVLPSGSFGASLGGRSTVDSAAVGWRLNSWLP